MIDTTIQVKTDRFDGPLGLLLLLVQKNEISIRDLSINDITHQYLDYLRKMEELNFDVAGDFLYMAATLVLLKSKACVSEEDVKALAGDDVDGELITSKADLIRRLEELQRFQSLGEKLWQLPRRGEAIFVKPKVNRKAIVNSFLCPMDLQELTLVMMDHLQKQRKKYKVIKRDRLSIKEKLAFLKTVLIIDETTTLVELIKKDKMGQEKENSRVNMVITFISLLELARLKRISLFQNETWGDVYVDVLKSLEDFDVESADGFESEEDKDEREKQEALEQSADMLAAQVELNNIPAHTDIVQ